MLSFFFSGLVGRPWSRSPSVNGLGAGNDRRSVGVRGRNGTDTVSVSSSVGGRAPSTVGSWYSLCASTYRVASYRIVGTHEMRGLRLIALRLTSAASVLQIVCGKANSEQGRNGGGEGRRVLYGKHAHHILPVDDSLTGRLPPPFLPPPGGTWEGELHPERKHTRRRSRWPATLEATECTTAG